MHFKICMVLHHSNLKNSSKNYFSKSSDFLQRKCETFSARKNSKTQRWVSKHNIISIRNGLFFVTKLLRRADVPIWRKSDLSRIDHRWHMSQKIQRGTSGRTLKRQYLALRAKPLSPAAICEALGRSRHPAYLLSWILALFLLKRVIFSAVFSFIVIWRKCRGHHASIQPFRSHISSEEVSFSEGPSYTLWIFKFTSREHALVALAIA